MTIKDREYYNYEGVDMGADFSSATIDMIRFKGYFVQVVTTGSPVGTFYMYSSNDPALATATNWKTIPYSTMVVNGADVHMYNQDGLYCRYVKLGYTRTSGSGTCSIRIQLKD